MKTAPATMTYDAATLVHALEVVRGALGTDKEWSSEENGTGLRIELQEQLLDWACDYHNEVERIGNSWLTSLASNSFVVLNTFLKRHGFEPMFKRFENGIGVAAILDLLVKWQSPGARTTITVGHHDYPAFSLNAGVHMYRVGIEDSMHDEFLCHDPLVQIVTDSGISLWLMTTTPPLGAPQLAPFASKILQFNRIETSDFGTNVVLPMLDIDNGATLDWLIGLQIEAPPLGAPEGIMNRYKVVQAFQQCRIRMNDEGARANVATGVAAVRGYMPLGHTFDRPFLGFFTLPADSSKPGIENVPLAPFFASYDSWKEPLGLEPLHGTPAAA